MKSAKLFQTILWHLVSFKLPLRFFALFAISFLTLAVGLLTYRGGVEIWGFFKVEHLATTIPGKVISQMMGWMMAASTFVQSGPIIWDKLSAWGQKIDNIIMKWIFHKPYFLDETEDLLKETRKLINMMNKRLLETSKEIMYGKKFSSEKYQRTFNDSMKKAYKNCDHIVKLLKYHEPCCHWTRERKAQADVELNNFIIQLTETFQKSHTLSLP